MKLNPDCVRDVLIWLEDNLKINEDNSFTVMHLIDLNNGLSQYNEDEIYYTVYNLFQVHFIEGKFSLLPSGIPKICEIHNITWNGHQFLNNIRPKSIWDATKAGASKLGIMSISALNVLAMEISKAVVTKPEVIQKIVNAFNL